MKTLSALMCVRNEEDVVEKALELLHPFVDEIVFVDMQSTDKTREIASRFPKVKLFDYPYKEPVNMGEARTFSLSKATGDWFLQVDADEYYPPESLQKIREFIENPGEAISLRINYHNLAWRAGFKQVFEHYPDRLYRTDVVQGWEGVLPLDMTVVKPEFRAVQHKPKGMQGVLEYDNVDDRSFELPDYPHKNPKQPIRKDIFFYHLARVRGFNYEYNKRLRYENFIHGPRPENERNTRWNQWVAGNYPMEPIEVPDYIPTKVIPSPKVSVLVSCYNKGQFIGETLESILANNPYEVIVVDDGSTDNSAQVIQKYPVKYVHQPNQGVAVARNRALDMMTGDYFILIDADDKLAPNYIQRTLQEMKGDVQVVWTDFQGLGEWDWRHHYSGNIEDLRTAQCIPSVMALCDARVRDNYGNFKADVHYEDAEWWLNLRYNRKCNFKHIPEPLCYYRRTTGSRIDLLDQKKQEGYAQLNNMFKEFDVYYA